MAVGYEARARITADVSGFVAAQRQAAQAAGTLAAAVAQLNTHLRQTERLAATSASSLRTITQASKTAAQAQGQNASASRQAAQAAAQGAAAYNASAQGAQQATAAMNGNTAAATRNSQSLQSMGREMARLSAQRRTLMQLQSNQGQLSQSEARALGLVRDRLRELGQGYARLNTVQRQVVDSSREMARAQSTVQQTTATMSREIRSAATEAARLARESQNTQSSIQGLDNSMWALRSSLGDVEGALQSIVTNALQLGRVMATAFSEQEMATAHLARVTQETDTQVAQMAGSIRQLGQEIPIAFAELGRIAVLGSQVGIADDQLVNFTESVALFSATTDVAEEQAALMFARIMEMTGIDDSQVRNLGAAISELGSNSAATEQEILTVVESISTVATQAGLSETTILGLGAAMASLRIRPELARGAVQRVFLELEQTALGAKDGTEALAEATNMTTQELAALAAGPADDFFLTLMQRLGDVAGSGENLIPILRSIGIMNTRDADVVARLAGNYQLLDDSVQLANESFQTGTFLHQESERLFRTLTSQVQIMMNAFQNLGASVVGSMAPLLSSLVEGATAVANFVAESELLTAIFGRLLIVGAVGVLFAGLGVAIAAAVRGWIGMRTVLQQTVLHMGTMSATAARTATSMGLMSAAARGAAASMGTLAASMRTAQGAATALRAAMSVVVPILVISLIIEAVGAISRLTQSAMEANEAHLTAAGGVEALRAAMIADTQAAMDSESALVFRRQALTAMTEEEREAAAESRDLAGNQRTLARELGISADSASETGSAVSGMGGSMSSAEVQARGLGAAIGEANQRFAAMAVESSLMEGDLLSNTRAFTTFRSELEEFGGVAGLVEMELTNAGSASEALNDKWYELHDSGNILTRIGRDVSSTINSLTGGFWDMRDSTTVAMDTMLDLASALDGVSEAQIEALNATELFDGQLQIAEDGTVTFTGGLNDLEGGAEGAADGMEEVVTAASQVADSVSEALGSVSQLGQGLEEEEQTLSNYADQLQEMAEARINFANNLLSLQGRVSDETLAIIADNADAMAPVLDELADAPDDVVEGWEEMLSFTEGELGERYRDAIESLTEDATLTQQQAVQDQLAELQRMFDADEIGAREFVEELESIVAEGVDTTAQTTQQQVEAISSMFQSGETDAGAYADALSAVFGESMTVSDQMIADQIAQTKAHFDAGEISAQEMVDQIESILADGDYTIEPEVDGFKAQRDGEKIRDNVERTALNAEPVFHMETDGKEARDGAKDTEDFVVTTADLADPVFQPRTSGGTAKEQMSSTRSDVEKTASNSRPTFKARTSGSQAFQDMSSIMGSLRSMASTIWVTVRGVSGGLTKGTGGRKDGGWVSGPGGVRQDKVPMWLSPQEFVVNAQDARDYAPLLQWINDQKGRGGRAGDFPRPAPTGTLAPMGMDSGLSRGLGRSLPPVAVRQSQATGSSQLHERIAITVNNTYPQAEPTSTTVNRSLQYAATLEGLSS